MVEAYIDPASDFLLLDGLESITVQFARPNGTHSVEIAKAMSSPVDLRRDTFVEVAIGSKSKVWSFRASDLDGEEIEAGDLITDSDGQQWEAAGATLRSFDTIYRVPCNRARRNA